MTLCGVPTTGVAVRELCPEPSRVRMFPPAFPFRDEGLRNELNWLTEGASPPVLAVRIIPSLDISPTRLSTLEGRGAVFHPSDRASPRTDSCRLRLDAVCRASSTSAFAFAAYNYY